MFMDKSSLDKDENEDKHSSCVLLLEAVPYEKKDINFFFKKMLIILCKEHLVTLTFC